jgi:hypothetical protein
MGEYDLSTTEPQFDGKPVWQSSGTKTAGYLYWLSTTPQWNIASQAGYTGNPYMKADENVDKPEDTTKWQSISENGDDDGSNYRNDNGVQVKCMDPTYHADTNGLSMGGEIAVVLGSLLLVALLSIWWIRRQKGDSQASYDPLSGGKQRLKKPLLGNGMLLQMRPSRARQNKSLDFPGRIVPGQKFCILSFPGIYEEEWKRMTAAEARRSKGKSNLISVACVFFPDGTLGAMGEVLEGTRSHFYGKHGTPCNCKKLYSGMPFFKEWHDGKAPFGCLWFDSWMNCAKQAHALGQQGVVVYKRGHTKDTVAGLGNSQRGEVAWLKEVGIPIVHHWDIDEFNHFSEACHDDEVWAQVDAHRGVASW